MASACYHEKEPGALSTANKVHTYITGGALPEGGS